MSNDHRNPAPRTTYAISMRTDHWEVLQQEARRMGLSVDAALEAAVRLYQAVNHQGEHFSVHAQPDLRPCPGCEHDVCLKSGCVADRVMTRRIPG